MLLADFWQLISSPSKSSLHSESPPFSGAAMFVFAILNQFSSVAEPLMCLMLMYLRQRAGSSRLQACKSIVRKHPPLISCDSLEGPLCSLSGRLHVFLSQRSAAAGEELAYSPLMSYFIMIFDELLSAGVPWGRHKHRWQGRTSEL